MKALDLYADPACPWSWLAVRWLTGVAAGRDLSVTVRSFSLWKRDGEQQSPGMPPTIRDVAVATSKQSLRLLRVFEALRADGREAAITPLYVAWGSRVFVPGPPTAPASSLVEELLPGLDAFLPAADDARWDFAIESSMTELVGLAGPTPLVPTLVTEGRVVFTGAILSAPPSPESGLALWDAIQTLDREPAFTCLTTARQQLSPTFA